MRLFNLQTFETGNRYHFMHTLALLAVPMTRKPMLVGIAFKSTLMYFTGLTPKPLINLEFHFVTRLSSNVLQVMLFVTQVAINIPDFLALQPHSGCVVI